MRIKRIQRALAKTAALTVLAGTLGVVGAVATATSAQAEDAPLLCGDSLIEKQLANGAAWRMCAYVHDIKGLVLEQIEFKAPTDREYAGYKRVLDSLAMGQLNVPYDTGHVQYNDITSYGFGKQYLMDLNEKNCKGEIFDVPQSFTYQNRLIEREVPGICANEVDTGLMTHAQETQLGGGVLYADQGTGLEVTSIAKISWYEYQQKVTFDDHGQIDVGLGATGDIAPGSAFFPTDPKVGWPLGGPTDANGNLRYGASHWHNAIWRVDFGIDKGARQEVEQWDFTSPGMGTRAPIYHGEGTTKTEAFSAVPGTDNDDLTWWRVLNPNSLNKDGHPRSYEIVNPNYTNPLIPFTAPTVTFTNNRACEEYASANLNPGCPGESILDYVDNSGNELVDPVAWVNVGFHHTDKDEDQSPMPIHWQGFQIVPRDFFAQKPTMTDARSCVNGMPGSAVSATARPCIATNTELPTVTADTGTVDAGTTLTATSGTWNTAHGQVWNFQYVWFRNGEPIMTTDESGNEVGATGETYTVTPADAGSAITVKVTASATGYPSGTAESAAVQVAGEAPSPNPEPTPGPSPTAAPDPVPGGTTVSSALQAKATKKSLSKKRPVIRVKVTSAGAPAGGTVQIVRGKKVLGTAKVNAKGVAKVKLKKGAIKKGKKVKVKAVYSGSATAAPSSTTLSIKVRGR